MTALVQVRRLRVLARRIDAATPPQRDRAVDALRALAIAGVIGGHWPATVHTIVFLVISPLWFLGVYAVLTALTPAAMWLVRRFGAWAAAFPVAVVAAADLVRFGLHGPSWVGWVNLPAGWLVPYLLGIAWAQGWLAQGSLRGRRVPALMLAGGAAATAALIAWAAYPASMVGVNGAHISN